MHTVPQRLKAISNSPQYPADSMPSVSSQSSLGDSSASMRPDYRRLRIFTFYGRSGVSGDAPVRQRNYIMGDGLQREEG